MTSIEDSPLQASSRLHELLISHGTKQTLPAALSIKHAVSKIHSSLPTEGIGSSATADHLLNEITTGLNGSSLSPNYYGFVTGGSTPIARLADQIVGSWDQNVSVHLPAESIATIVEDRALYMLLQLFDLSPETFVARTLTTGATASNILGLASGRDYVLERRSRKNGREYIPEKGLLQNCLDAGIRKIQVLATSPHSSLGKAASIVGLGSGCVVDVSTRQGGGGILFDMDRLEACLSEKDTVSIVAVSCSEVNIGGFATTSLKAMQDIRQLCDKYGAWLHVDAAFGLFATLLPSTPQYEYLRSGTAGISLADSITSDGHKLLNVPYDTGMFFSRHASTSANVFSNPNAPYLRSSGSDSIISPLNLGLENSRRWRALPVYANLLAYGHHGLSDMVVRMVELARAIANHIVLECPWLEVIFPDGPVESKTTENELTSSTSNSHGNSHSNVHNAESKIPEQSSNTQQPGLQRIFMIVAFRARDESKNQTLVQRIKDDRRIYVSGTVLEGKPAARIAVAKWDVDVERDLDLVKAVLRDLA